MTKDQLANYLKPWVKGYGANNEINALQLADNIIALIAKPKASPNMWGQIKQVIEIAQKDYPLAANWMINMSGKTFSAKDGNK